MRPAETMAKGRLPGRPFGMACMRKRLWRLVS
jgi:hypothetical protein